MLQSLGRYALRRRICPSDTGIEQKYSGWRLVWQNVNGAKKELKTLIEKYKVDIIAIGNGTASRESESFVADMIKEIERPLHYAIVSEAGASVYSASKLASEEYPDINVSL
ncbi:hypothetical protein [uncultured Brachyspira sp.]|uniref:hypothetical protein n=1 Tax=uncultured Brachyspira sp. TaxID=221953 RepID=UPI003211C3D0